MKRNLCLLVFACCVAPICFSAQAVPLPVEVQTYELYSWKNAKGGWMFSLLPGDVNAGYHPDVIMRPSNTLMGRERLKRAIAALPADSEIIWLDHAVGAWKDAKGWERIKFPPAEIITDIRRYCEGKKFKLSVEYQRGFED